ncbi:L-threonylcarbamoyladenylate synthase [Aquibacillus saliphilus]|uniref:L-threonylcarbamoyladenylate synthase n=1 Tax=Aquibacillus saliphilus TaxID=1909422 RepID=UPI001CF0627F|nr:L-threonylcarbamoyladenylate synthase [Aquibacillus saliphilus]
MTYKTKLWKIENITKDVLQIEAAANLLKKLEVVAFPTETVYGLGADATNEQAVAKIFQAKGRPADNPLIVHVANKQQIEQYVTHVPDVAKKLIHAFMPGPLTIILPSNNTIATNVTAGLSSIAIRIPSHPVARQLLEVCQLPLAAPSANKSGKPSPTSADHVVQDLNGKIAGILDGGTTGVGLESTVLDCTTEIPVILRPGGITKQQIEQVVGMVMVDPALVVEADQPKAPGMKYNHYQPDAPLSLIDGDVDFFQAQIDSAIAEGLKVGIMASTELASLIEADNIKTCGSRTDLKEVAVHLYDTLRAFKKSDVDLILCETFEQTGVGEAIMNRLHKAATKKVNQTL